MPRYMLDTNTCSYIMKRSHPPLLKRSSCPGQRRVMSVITKAELLYGAEVCRGAPRMAPPSRRFSRMSRHWTSSMTRRSTTPRSART